jgi:hypothetical protein
LFVIIGAFKVNGQEHQHKHNQAEEDEHAHNDRIEIGFGVGAVYNFGEKTIAPGVHLHLFYNFNRIGLGIGAEQIFFDERHTNLAALLAIRPLERIELTLAPGVLLENEETGKNLFSMHFEASYLWEIKKFGHLGPVVSYSFAGDEKHALLGIHYGLHF